MVDDDEEITICAQESGKGLIQGIVVAEIIDFGVEDFARMAGLFDFEAVESGSMDEADDMVATVDDGKMLITGLVETVEGEWSEDFVVIDVSNGGGWEHDLGDFDAGKIHNGSDYMTFATIEDGARSTFQYVEKFLDCLGSIRFVLRSKLLRCGSMIFGLSFYLCNCSGFCRSMFFGCRNKLMCVRSTIFFEFRIGPFSKASKKSDFGLMEDAAESMPKLQP